jgi:tetratricopeptide (TPR) repeat protein
VLGPVELPMAASLPFAWEDHGGATFLRRPEHDGEAAPPPAARRPAGPPSAAPAVLGPLFLAARHLAQLGALTDAERLARAAAEAEGGPEPWLLLAQLAEARGEVEVALAEVARALEVEPALPVGHAARAALLRRLGQPALAGMARADALHALEGAPDDLPLRAVEPVAAGALRRALAGGMADDA